MLILILRRKRYRHLYIFYHINYDYLNILEDLKKESKLVCVCCWFEPKSIAFFNLKPSLVFVTKDQTISLRDQYN